MKIWIFKINSVALRSIHRRFTIGCSSSSGKIISIILIAIIISCKSQGNQSKEIDSVVTDTEIADEASAFPKYLNSVKGHKEEEVIVGNFTGLGIDTVYVVEEKIDSIYDMLDGYKFYAKSNNPALHKIELFGCGYATPMLVYEGDVDGDGKDEWGYLQTWLNSQWRQYRIYNYDSKRKKWRHLYYDIDMDGEQLLSTPEYVRASGVDIVENGPKPGLIKINYGTWGAKRDLRDTIVKPTYTPISEEAL